jgi:hypothetical protein
MGGLVSPFAPVAPTGPKDAFNQAFLEFQARKAAGKKLNWLAVCRRFSP